MGNRLLVLGFLSFWVITISGCVVRTYQVTKDRVDQDLYVGNRGYLQGQAPKGGPKERKTTRKTQVVEIELHSPIKFEKAAKGKAGEMPQPIEMPAQKSQDSTAWGNRGYVTQGTGQETVQPEAATFEKYTVEKNDTLQKISKKFYGTTKKWMKIYEANRGTLKSPDKVYPGKVLNIPLEPLKEPQENLK